MTLHRRIFWALVLVVAGITTYVVRDLVPLALLDVRPANLHEQLLAYAVPHCHPEPVEQLRFVVAALLPVVLMAGVTRFAGFLGAFAERRRSWSWATVPAVLAQLLLAAAGSWALTHEARYGYKYRFFDVSAVVSLAAVTVVLLAGQAPYPRGSETLRLWTFLKRLTWLPWVLASTWILAFTVTGLFKGRELSLMAPTTSFHLPFTMGEFAAAVNGRTPLSDFNSQYQNVLPLLSIPVFKLFGMSITTFTATMATLSTLGLLLAFSAFARVCKSPWTALLLFAPCLPVCFYGEEMAPGGYVSNSFNYYAAPLRYIGVFVLARLAVWYLERNGLGRLVTLGAVALLVALNNMDFGIPAAAGVLACAILFPPRFSFQRTLPTRRMLATAVFIASAAVSLASYVVALRLLRGTWVQLSHLFMYQRLFASLGFYMIAAPDVGLYWIIYLTSMSAILVPVYEVLSGAYPAFDKSRRLLNGSLAYWGIASLGPVAYYMGRSHPKVLEATFCAWIFVLIHLAYRAWHTMRALERAGQATVPLLSAVPMVSIFALGALVAPMALEVPSPTEQLQRLRPPDVSSNERFGQLIGLIKQYVPPGETTMIIYGNGHEMAILADVNNVFPYANKESMMLKAQVEETVAAIDRLPRGHETIFGSIPEYMQALIRSRGFEPIQSLADFQVWRRTH